MHVQGEEREVRPDRGNGALIADAPEDLPGDHLVVVPVEGQVAVGVGGGLVTGPDPLAGLDGKRVVRPGPELGGPDDGIADE